MLQGFTHAILAKRVFAPAVAGVTLLEKGLRAA
jgi:hypothetical protein